MTESIDNLIDRLRTTYTRLTPAEAHEAVTTGRALLVDIRYQALRDRDGLIPGALIVERNELEWRLDPQGTHKLPEAVDHTRPWIVVCNEGYASTLAAVSLHTLGLTHATDLIGGYQAWKSTGHPTTPPT
ncbi:rhodanese-like domain-containing protein [Streptomyces sp. BI20]|uniref:rhodanese-like domain-containing protein n=1 Tax=Streptomyces sp. BI20 TaxID=3403460 RepID=UPI003C710844